MISERHAFEAMRLFVEQFYARAGHDIETLLADIGIEVDGERPLTLLHGATGFAVSNKSAPLEDIRPVDSVALDFAPTGVANPLS